MGLPTSAAALFLTFLTNPLFDLVLLGVAVYSGQSALRQSLRHAVLSLKKPTKSKVEKAARELRAELDGRSVAFQRAVARMKISVHPVLQQVLIDFSQVDCAFVIPERTPSTGTAVPEVREALRSPEYRSQLPPFYQPLLDLYA